MCLVAQLCLILCDPMDYSPPGSSVHGDSPGKNTGVGCLPPEDLLNPGIEPRSPTLQVDTLLSELLEKLKNSPGDLQDQGIKLRSPALQVDSIPAELPGNPLSCMR